MTSSDFLFKVIILVYFGFKVDLISDFLFKEMSVHMYVCGVPNKKLVSLACMPNEQKVWNVKMASISVFVCIYFCACVWCAKYKISIFGIYTKWAKKWKIQKWYLYLCVHVSVCTCISVCVVCHL